MNPENTVPSSTLIVILGAYEWPYYSQLNSSVAFRNSAEDLTNYFLSSTLFNLPRQNIIDLFNSDLSASDMLHEIADFIEKRKSESTRDGLEISNLIIYYVGHGGFVGGQSLYYLAVKSTRQTTAMTSGILVESLASAIKEQTLNLRTFVMIDACFSAAAYQCFQSSPSEVVGVQVQELFRKGVSLLCSSSSKAPSRLLENHTMFTSALLEVLNNGSSNNKKFMSFNDVSNLLRERLYAEHQDKAVRPEVHSPLQTQGDITQVELFPNPQFTQLKTISEEDEISQPLGIFLEKQYGMSEAVVAFSELSESGRRDVMKQVNPLSEEQFRFSSGNNYAEAFSLINSEGLQGKFVHIMKLLEDKK
jgi:hypothetical protein